jgi:flagellin
MLNRMMDLSVESANGILDDVDRGNVREEITAITNEIDRIAENTNFNGMPILGGEFGTAGEVTPGSVPTGAFAYGFSVAAASTMQVPSMFANMGTGPLSIAYEAPTSIKFEMANKNGGAPLSQTYDIADQINYVNGDSYTISLGNFAQIAVQNDADMSPSAFPDTPDFVAQALAATLASSAPSVTALTPQELEAAGLRLQISDDASGYVNVHINNMSAAGLDLIGVSMETPAKANTSISLIKNAINVVSSTRGDLGAMQNRLEYTINNLNITTENMTETESKIRDTNMAKEMMGFTKNNVLSQSAQSMLAQANMQPQQVLELLR